MKKAYRIYRERGYRLRLLSAAFRNHLHWSEFIGGDVVISPPFEWQKRFNESDVTVEAPNGRAGGRGDRGGAGGEVRGLPPRISTRRA